MRETKLVKVGDTDFAYVPIDGVAGVERLPYSLRVLLENALRTGDDDGAAAIAAWDPELEPASELAFSPGRVLLQDFTGVPAIVDLAAMRDAVAELGGEPGRVDPLLPSELVIDHSVQVDSFATRLAIERNVELEYERNGERYAFLRWGQGAFDSLKVVPPNTGICHQVNLEYLARVVESREQDGRLMAFPDTLVGTDSHTTMVNGLGVLGWGVGGIEAEAAMLGEPVSMLVPQVVGLKLTGELSEPATATDLVLTVTEILRRTGVVGKFVEYFGPGLLSLTIADRATIANMSPEYGATCGFWPVDEQTVAYLELTGRDAGRMALVEAYCKANLLWHEPDDHPAYSEVVELDLGTVEPSIAGPRRPQDRVPLREARDSLASALTGFEIGYGNGTYDREVADSFPASDPPTGDASEQTVDVGAPAAVAVPARTSVPVELDGERFELDHGSVVIAAITSCTNTSNPQVLVTAGLLAKNAVERGLDRQAWVKTSMAPGSRVVTRYLDQAGLTPYFEQLGFHTVGYGCTTCIGNSGPLSEPISKAVADGNLVVASVLSGNRNFEARIHPEVKANYLASPPLVVAFALAGRIDVDLTSEPVGRGADGADVYLADLWPSAADVQEVITASVRGDLFRETYADVYTGDDRWRALPVPEGDEYDWDPASTYIRLPPYFAELTVRAHVASRDRRGSLPRPPRRQRDDRPHLSCWLDQPAEPGRQLSARARRGARRVQLLRLATGQPRGDGARDVRERAAQEPPRRGQRRHLDGSSAWGRGDVDLRRRGAIPRGASAARRHRRQGIRLRIVARLGREGAGAARSSGSHRRELRADPSLEPADDGRSAARVRRGGRPRVTRPDRP